ncbi:putative electron transfer flavoprotein FixB [Budvicia aquatica]|uniref:Putative electron transfer flavoprotein FixB n=1 Tax=Budvicia aquatica TaxID=82979 RepID=A0A484ZCT6_9GAMM|nr:putative electron transfer flavoprotein FixB [Budvicia aquatica]
MSKLSNVWVFSDNQSRLAEIMAGAAQLGDCISVFVLGTQAEISAAHALGATKVFALGEREVCRIVEDYADTMANAIAGGDKPTLVLLPATRRGKALAAKLGAKLNAGCLTTPQRSILNKAKCRPNIWFMAASPLAKSALFHR